MAAAQIIKVEATVASFKVGWPMVLKYCMVID